jgi:predicted SprT family Zn-dependent metalloprotease
MMNVNDIITQLEDMYKFFNKELEAELPEDVVFSLIPNRGRSSYYGWFARSRWIHNNERLHEINIASDYLNRSVADIAETVIHEMAHLANHIKGIKDCTKTQYHNKHFKKQAEEFGLKVDKMRNKGFALTCLDEKGKEIVDKYSQEVLKGKNPFSIYRVTEKRQLLPSDKKQVGVDKPLAHQVLALSGDDSFTKAVDNILRDWVAQNA